MGTPNVAEQMANRIMQDTAKKFTNPAPAAAPVVPELPPGTAPISKAYSPFERSLKSFPARRGQEQFDYHDTTAKNKGFAPGAGTDAIAWAKMAASAKSHGRLGLGGLQKEIEDSQDTRMLAGFKSMEAFLDNQDVSSRKALVESSFLDGGALVPPEFSAEFIYLLRASTVVLESGASVVQMGGLTLNIGRQNAAGTAYYEGEAQAVTPSQQQFGALSLQAHKLMALTPVSNDLLRDGGPSVEAIVRDDLIQVVALRQDLAWLRGDGTLGTCKGLLNLINATNQLTATQGGSSATFQEIAYDVGRMYAALKNANIDKFAPDTTWGWVMSPRSEQYLRTVASTFGVFPFKDGMEQQKQFFGLKYMTTTAIPNNLSTGGNASEVYLVAWPAYLIGMNMPLELRIFPDGTAPDLNGTIISGIANDMTWLRAITRHDSKLRYDLGAAYLGSVLWGT